MKKVSIAVFLIILIAFVYFRVIPILNQTVPYTYDQGRDFLKATEIIRDKHLPFIGPTTGIQGVFHGAWWYYFVLIPYLLFSGWPQGFYFGLFFFNLLANLWFFWFLKKNFSLAAAFFFLGIVSVSTFFIKTAFYASNNTLAPLFILTFIYSLYHLFDKKKWQYLFLAGLSLGFVFETEMAFGLFIIPAFLIVFLLFKDLRHLLKSLKNICAFFAGMLIPIGPRLLFELKNNFLQTRSFLAHLSSPENIHPLLFRAVAEERFRSFWQYWSGLFYRENLILALLFLLALSGLILLKNKAAFPKKNTSLFVLILTLIIFVFSLLYKNSFFWSYYLDGIQYLFLFLMTAGFYLIEKNKKISLFAYLLLTVVIGTNIFALIKDVSGKKNVSLVGLRADNKIVSYFVENTKHQYFCLKIYTPPVIPYTYMYLLSYYADRQKILYPKGDFYNNQCYYLIDKDEYQFRVDKWRDENIPKNSKLNKTVKFENGSRIELWVKN